MKSVTGLEKEVRAYGSETIAVVADKMFIS